MNPFQRARAEAHVLREKLLGPSLGNTPVKGSVVVGRVEQILNLGVERVHPSSTDLGGGDACLNRTDSFIYVRRDVDPSETASLVAHELGHFVLDADVQATTVAKLAEIAQPAGTPGVVVIEAYGARERQELQANVFGRELLLPRHLAKQLFDAGHGPRKIAEDLDLPLDLVRLQILDAALLPPDVPTSLKPLHSPSTDQALAARASERYVNVVAGPGTGKTSTLIHRVKYLIEDLKVDPSQILVLTFTNKAAFELVDRLRSTGMDSASSVWAGTFHAFGLEFFRKFHHCFNLPSDIKVADKLNGAALLLKQLPKATLVGFSRLQDPYDWLGLVLKCIQRLKEEMVTPEQYRAFITENTADDQTDQLRREDVATLYSLYEASLKTAGMVDFVDLVAGPARAIRNDRARYAELADRFKYILVDEYQDVTYAMVDLITRLAPSAKSLWVVGDVRQAIHHWRGASVRSLLVFEEKFRNQAPPNVGKVQKYPLSNNRRSSSEILALVTHAGTKHALQPKLPLDVMMATSGPSGDTPLFYSGQEPTGYFPTLVAEVSRLQAQGTRFAEQAVISRAAKDLRLSAKAMEVAGIPVLYVGDLMDRQEIKALVCVMQLLVERQPKALVGLMGHAGFHIELDSIKVLLDAAKTSVDFQRGRWIGAPPPDLCPTAQKAVATIKLTIGKHNAWSSPWHLICDLLLEHKKFLPSDTDSSMSAWNTRIALWQFAHASRVGDGDGKRLNLIRYLGRQDHRYRLGETHQDRELPPEAASLDAVKLLTVHGSKGLEYEAVHVVALNKDSYGQDKPFYDRSAEMLALVPPEALGSSADEYAGEQSIERNNLLYVALSRAKRRLRLYEDASYKDRDRPLQLAAPSTLFKLIPVAAVGSKAPSHAAPLKKPATSAQISFSEFETYARCPLQHHYRFHLGLVREQEPDTALNARYAVMQTLEQQAKHNSYQDCAAVLEQFWGQTKLPTSLEDPQLWNEALTLAREGAEILQASGGTWAQPIATIRSVTVELPWMVAKGNGSAAAGHMIRVAPYGIGFSKTLLQPLLLGCSSLGTVDLTCLLTETQMQATPSRWIEKTNAYKAAGRLLMNDRSPAPGSHCDRCGFRSICPSSPG